MADGRKRLFAWAIKPTMSAMVLGSVYLGGAYFFVRAARARRWHTVAGGFPPVATFAALMGIATILHWDRFIHGNLAFWLWVALYLTTPFVVFGVFVRNQCEYVAASGAELAIPTLAATVIVAAGDWPCSRARSCILFPDEAIDVWPWPLTRLTARMLGAIFALGLAGLGAWRERRWSAARILVQVAGIMVLLILVAGVRARHEFDAVQHIDVAVRRRLLRYGGGHCHPVLADGALGETVMIMPGRVGWRRPVDVGCERG